MLHRLQRPAAEIVFPDAEKKILTEKGIISALKGITEQRFQAISVYPNSRYFNESIGLINQLRDDLNNADEQLNYKSAVKICLRLENPLLYLAPRSTSKIFNTYKEKIDFLMPAA